MYLKGGLPHYLRNSDIIRSKVTFSMFKNSVKPAGTTEFYHSTKKQQHSFDILKNFYLCDIRNLYSDECQTMKAFQYVKRMLLLFRAVVKLC